MNGEPILKTWGAEVTGDTPFRRGFDCPECGNDLLSVFNLDKEIGQYIVGFSTDYKVSCSGLPRVGAAVFECPKCFTRFCFHVTQLLFYAYSEQCPIWPREKG